MKKLNIRNFIVTIFISNCFLILFWFYFYKKILYYHRDWITIINKKNYPNQYFNNDKLQKILNYQEKYTKQLEYFREFNLLTKISDKPIFNSELNYYNSFNGSEIWNNIQKISNNSNFNILLSGYHSMTNILTYSFYNGYLNITHILEKEYFYVEYIENLFILYRQIFHSIPLIKQFINLKEVYQKKKNITNYENSEKVYYKIFNVNLIESIIFLFESIIEKYKNIKNLKFFSDNEINQILLLMKRYKNNCYICYKYIKYDFEGFKIVNKLLRNEFITNKDIIKYFSIFYRISKSINYIKIIDSLLKTYQNKLSKKIIILNIFCFFLLILLNLIFYQFYQLNKNKLKHNIFKKKQI